MSNRLWSFLALVFTAALSAANPLHGEWKFKTDPKDEGTTAGWQQPGVNDASWQRLEVPGPWPVDYDGVGWCRKSIDLPTTATSAAENGRLILSFQQVDDHAVIYVNGRQVAYNTSYNAPFFAEITTEVLTLSPERLSVAVKVLDLGMGGGILGPVQLLEVENPVDLFKSAEYEKTVPSTIHELGGLVMYSVYVRNFSQEGTFDALRKRLPELKSLGVNVLWLLPIHEIGEAKRKGVDGSPYAIRDYYSIHPELGTKEDFRQFVDSAHAHGMRVIIDCVLNHTSPDSVLVKQHPDWFIQDAQGTPIPEVLEWDDVVDFDWEKKPVWSYATEMLEYWVRDMNIDGFRCDVADLVPAEFWKQARERLEKIKPGQILMLAESTQAGKHLEGFDITYHESLRDNAIAVITGKQPATALKQAILAGQYGYPKDAARLLFVENHDKERAINTFGGPEQAKLGAVLTATLPGVPLLYTGTEVGATADREKTFFVRSPVDFTTDEHGMRAFWTTLMATRASHPALQTGDLRLLDSSPAVSTFAYERTLLRNQVVLVLNMSDKTQRITVDHPLVTGGAITLGPYQYSLFSRE